MYEQKKQKRKTNLSFPGDDDDDIVELINRLYN